MASLARPALALILAGLMVLPTGCSVFRATYHGVEHAYNGTAWVLKGSYELAAGTTRVVYSIGKYTWEVVRAPLAWPLMNKDIERMDGLPVKEAIRLGRVKTAPYVVKGRTYIPMTVAQARDYDQTGIASWYGDETLRSGSHMTADGEVFKPMSLTAAHKYLPLPTNVEVTNLDNGRSIVVRVNDRGPFPSDHNAASGRRIIDLSLGAAQQLGFVRQGIARVRVRTIALTPEAG